MFIIFRTLIILLLAINANAENLDLHKVNLSKNSKIELYEHHWNKGEIFTPFQSKAAIVTFQKKLTEDEVAELVNLAKSDDMFFVSKSPSACFQPRHTLVIDNQTMLRICFDCTNFSVDDGTSQGLGRSEELYKLFSQFGAPFASGGHYKPN